MHISEHLDEPLTLRELADVAGFSPYHFHRIFKGVMGETLTSFIWRLRLERRFAYSKGVFYDSDEPGPEKRIVLDFCIPVTPL